jgi:hypothetical protein
MTDDCDHIIAVQRDYEGENLCKVSDLGSFCYIDEMFKFCPRCGEPVTVTEQEIEQLYKSSHQSVQSQPGVYSSLITREALKILINKSFTDYINANNVKIGSALRIRLPTSYRTPDGEKS